MVTEDDEDVDLELNLDQYNFHSEERRKGHRMSFEDEEEEECVDDGSDLYQQLAEKDHYLMLAAEAGKVLLEKNQELTNHYENLHDDYQQKIEQLEQERHHLRRELTDRENNYESRMQDLQYEVSTLSGQLDVVQRTSKSFEKSHQSTYSDLSVQNESLHKELSELKSCNNGLMQQVTTLSKRIDARSNENRINNNDKVTRNSYYGSDDEYTVNDSNGSIESDHQEMKKLREQLRQLEEHKQFLEESLNELVTEKDALSNTQKRSLGKIAGLEDEVSSLRNQMSMCHDDLDKSRRKNVQLKDQLEEYVLLQQSSQFGSAVNNSLFNELEMSLSEADMNFQSMSTPMKQMKHIDDDEKYSIPEIITSQSNSLVDKVKSDMRDIYSKLKRLKQQLSDDDDVNEEEFNEQLVNNGELVIKLVDDVILLIHEKVLSLGAIDARSDSPCRLDLENCDELSQADSQMSDRDVDILEQQVHDLNQRLNITTTELESVKRDLLTSQAAARDNEEKAQTLTVKSNAQEREIDALRKEREIVLADTSMEEKLRQALEERDAALTRENAIQSNFEQTQNDMQKLNNQLIAAVQQKLVLSEQLEQWQFDMASLIDQQLKSKIKREQQTTRKRSNSTTPSKFFSGKFFASKNNSKEVSRSNTPTLKPLAKK